MVQVKAHLVQCAEPLFAGDEPTATCGQDIWNAQVVHAWDSAEVREKLDLESIRGLCTKCKKLYVPIEGRSLLYAVSSGVVDSRESMEAQE